MDKELKKIFKELERQGFEVYRRPRTGHYKVMKDGRWIAEFGGTISDWRGIRNSIAACRRAGFKWPP